MADVADKHEIKTTAQVERTYVVQAEDEEQAKKRLRVYIADQGALREGVVTKLAKEVNTTPERIKAVAPFNGQVNTLGQAVPVEE